MIQNPGGDSGADPLHEGGDAAEPLVVGVVSGLIAPAMGPAVLTP